MKNIWIVLSNRDFTEIYNWPSSKSRPAFVKRFSCNDARLQTKEMRNDKKGRLFEHFSTHRHSTGVQHEENEILMHEFTKNVADFLEKSRKENKFFQMILIAAPKVLGDLRSYLSKTTHGKIIKSLATNPKGFSEGDILHISRMSLQTGSQPVLDF